MSKSSMSVSRLPGVGELVSETWSNLRRNAGTMLMVYVIGIAAYFLIVLATVLVLIATGVVAGVNATWLQSVSHDPTMVPKLVMSAIGGLGLLILLVVIAMIAVGAVLQASVIYAAAQIGKHISVGEAIRVGKSRALPLFVASLLVGLLVMGGFFLFIIPGIVLAILFSMVSYEVVIGNAGIIKGITVSAGLVKKYFWDVLGRILVLILISIVVAVIPAMVQMVLKSIVGTESALMIGGLLRLVVNIFLSLFAVIYSTTFYQQLKSANGAEALSLAPVVIISVLGWLIGLFLIGSIAAGISKLAKDFSNPNSMWNQTGPGMIGGNSGDDAARFNDMMMQFGATPVPSATPVAPLRMMKATPAPRY